MTTTFVFVDNASIDRGTRRSIRSHVMRGKNTGKIRATRRQLIRTSNEIALTNQQRTSDLQKKYVLRPQRENHLSLGFPDGPNLLPMLIVRPGSELSGLMSPFEITNQDRHSIYIFLDYVRDAVYPAEFCKDRPDPGLTIWFEYVLSDETFFHSFIAMSEACMDFMTDRSSVPSSYSRHLASALRLINGNLSSQNALDDTNLASVVFLCLLSSLREQPLQTKLHFDGLCYMIAARGGVDAFSGNPGIVQKARRVDIDLALQLGRTPVLRKRGKLLSDITSEVSHRLFLVDSAFLNAISSAGSKLLAAVQRVAALAQLLNSTEVGNKIDGFAFEDTVTTTCYYLLEIQPITNSSRDMPPTEVVIYLTLLSFMTTLLFQFGRQRYLRYELLCRSLQQAFGYPEVEQAMDPTLRLWCLIIAGVSVITKGEHLWLKPRLSQICAELGLSDWGAVRNQLERYPWISNVHCRPAFHLWQTCHILKPGQ